MVTKMTHQVYLPDDVWGEVKDFLIPPKKPDTIHPNAQILHEVGYTDSHTCFLFTNASSQDHCDEIYEYHGHSMVFVNLALEFQKYWNYYEDKYGLEIQDYWKDGVWNGIIPTYRIQGVEDTYR